MRVGMSCRSEFVPNTIATHLVTDAAISLRHSLVRHQLGILAALERRECIREHAKDEGGGVELERV